ncbi:MAG: hypothetical protein JNK37_12650 [Verrucomicrobiales bacterium]|nr:hypothetical protein [Verrucomicrobiales bacterium]
MKKFIMALSILAMGGGAFLGVLNKQTLTDERGFLAEAQKKVTEKKNELNQVETDLTAAKEESTKAKDERDQISAALSEAQQQIKRQEAQIATAEAELEKMRIEKEEIDLAIKKIFPPGSPIQNIQQLQQAHQALKDQLTEVQNKKTDLMNQIQQAQTQMVQAEQQVRELETYQIDRAKQIALNGLEATVIAVNRNFGFVMVNAGKNLGVTPDSAMLVKRGQDRIARLQIRELEPNVLVADVVPSSLADGVRVQPGDKVIFENTK